MIFSLSPLRARKSDNYSDSWKSDNFRERYIKKKQRTDTKRSQRGLRAITLERDTSKKKQRTDIKKESKTIKSD